MMMIERNKIMIKCKASMHLGKKYSIKHNMRNYDGWNKDGHIDPSRTPMNVTLVNEDLRKWFYDIFADAILAYNEKNKSKHPDRVKTVAEYFKEQKGKVQEALLQLGDHETYVKLVEQIGQEKADAFYKETLIQIYENWKNDNPSLRIFHASIHMDEVENGTPHLHIDFLPIAESNRGLTTKISLDGALKQLGFNRDKKEKYGNTPYKQLLRDRREKLEYDLQKMADSILGKDIISIQPSEHSSKPHQETWEHRAEQKGLKAVKAFVTGEGKAKVKAAEEIIANANTVAKAITAEAERKMKAADKRTGEAVRKEKVAEKRMQETEVKSNALAEKTALFRERVKQFKGAFANAIVMQEQEVQRRLSSATFPMRQHEENERYLQRRRTAFAMELEQEQGKAEQQRTQEMLEKVKHKSTKGKGDFER